MSENEFAEPLKQLRTELGVPGEASILLPDCAQCFFDLKRSHVTATTLLTIGRARVMWCVMRDGHSTLYGDHPRGKMGVKQLAVAINATIDRSFSQV